MEVIAKKQKAVRIEIRAVLAEIKKEFMFMTDEQIKEFINKAVAEALAARDGKEKPFNIDNYKDGETFTYKGIEFVRLGEEQGGVLAIKKEPTPAMQFGDNNDYRESKVKDYIEQEFLPKLDKSDLLPYEMDLIADNGDKAYGKYTAYAGIISCDIYRKYRDYIPLPDEDTWGTWTCTPWSARSGYTDTVRHCWTSGCLGISYATSTYGVSPACIFKKPVATVGGKK